MRSVEFEVSDPEFPLNFLQLSLLYWPKALIESKCYDWLVKIPVYFFDPTNSSRNVVIRLN